MPGQKDWIVNEDPAIVQVPFPDGYWTEDTDFDLFCTSLGKTGLAPDAVAGVIMETYQGVGPDFAPVAYVRALREWCTQHGALLIFDEVQAGFGRCGTMWGFEHYGVVPDLICFGKGVSSSLPLSGVIGPAALMDQYAPGSMTSTHTGNPVCAAAALASLRKIVDEDLPGNAARMEPVLMAGLRKIAKAHAAVVGHVTGKGLVAGVQMIREGTKEPDADLAFQVVERCLHKGLLFFAPVGSWGQTVKIAPPLTIGREAIEDGLSVLSESVREAVG
jgi:4-aminobutyrate aminotransferase-like enzyme